MSAYKYHDDDRGESQGEYFGTSTSGYSGRASGSSDSMETIKELVKLLSSKEKAALIKELLK